MMASPNRGVAEGLAGCPLLRLRADSRVGCLGCVQAFAAQLAAQPTPILRLDNIVKAHTLLNRAEIADVGPRSLNKLPTWSGPYNTVLLSCFSMLFHCVKGS